MTITAAVPQMSTDEAQKRAIADAVWSDLFWLMPPDRTVIVTVTQGRVAVELGPMARPRFPFANPASAAASPRVPRPACPSLQARAFPFDPMEDFAMPDSHTADPFGPVVFAYTPWDRHPCRTAVRPAYGPDSMVWLSPSCLHGS